MGEENVLIVVVAQFKDEKKVLNAICEAGASGITYFYGRGTGVRQKLGFLGNLIQKEKVIFLTAVPSSKSTSTIESINKNADLDKPGKGFACVLKLDQVFGLL
jgi:nitrogen regulatory protein PII